jgi:ATP-binding cassette subfamily B protein
LVLKYQRIIFIFINPRFYYRLRSRATLPQQPAKIPIREYYRLLATYLRPQWRTVLLLAGLILGSIGTQLINPQIMRFFIDTASQGGSPQVLIRSAIIFIAAALLQQILSVLATYVGENLGWTTTNELRSNLVSHCLSLDLSFHKLHTPGEMIERIDEDVTSLANFFSQFTIRVFGNILIIAGVLILLFMEDYRVGVTITLFVLITLFTMQMLRDKITAHQWIARQAGAELSGYIEERLAGAEDIRANGAVPHVMHGLFQQMRRRNQVQLKANCYSTSVQMSAAGLHYLGIALALLLGALLARHNRESIGTIYLFVMYTDLIFRPIMQITKQIEDFQRAGAGIQRIQELYRITPEIQDGSGPDLPAGPLPVDWKDVAFSYAADDDKVLDGISFHLEPGQTLGLLGRTGSGKTTITRLLTRLYDYDEGFIRLGGIELKETRVADLRRRVGLVTQDVQLFHATVRDNVTFFNSRISDGQIEAVFNALGLDSWLHALPHGLDTILTAGGGLSAGEAQLLALSRVFLREPGLIIMDEASSRLDPATEQIMETALEKLLAGRTGIIVAHRLSTILRVDKILILEDGAVREYGDREQLTNDPDSIFRHLLETGLEQVMT